ncbi:hypothetical protein [Hymenobacter negativus]|uniref:IPExxxVDY family protein n=1 Tax=Hymenobacter negativus TaxID=2795026 RepID=A0ABS3QEB0_9BACT|nr:hypothetical protein [Hymenobacter negativus]MBO2009159.1 hypothetical protein [Hymenobacter negativus]
MPPNANIRYKVDFDYLSTLLLPALLRKPKLRAWLAALLAPLRQLYATFLLYAEATRIELAYNSQTIVLEGALNDQFDPLLRRIRIDNSDTELIPLYLNFVSELQPDVYLLFAAESPPWTYCYGYVEFSTQTDFTVRVPVLLRNPQRTDQLNARIRHFKLATRHYRLLFV